MARFNVATKVKNVPNTVNLAGGAAFSESEKMEVFSILACSFTTDQFYRSGDATIERLRTLVKQDPLFAAKAAVYARQELGMRSITHVAMAEVARAMRGVGASWVKDAITAVVRRPDDMTEMVAYYFNTYKDEPLPNAMKKGIAAAFTKFNEYSLAKYRGESKEVKLVDIANLTHPVPTAENKKAIKELVKGTLASKDTWEVLLTKAGQKGKNPEEVAKLKEKAWKKLIKGGDLPYFAALRNLRNISEQAPEALDDVLELITDEKVIKKSLVLPFRFTTAMEALESVEARVANKVRVALDEATEISLNNVPKLKGTTLVVLDSSGSMEGRPAQIGSLFAAVLCKTNKADLMLFSDDAKYVTLNTRDSVTTIANNIPFISGGTNFPSIFRKIRGAYDRIIILSDMQGWVENADLPRAFKSYKAANKCDPTLYSFDLAGYGSLMFPENKVLTLAGFSEKILDLMPILEDDKAAIVKKMSEISFDKYGKK